MRTAEGFSLPSYGDMIASSYLNPLAWFLIIANWSTRGSSVIPLRITWLTNMFTYWASRCFACARLHDLGTRTCFVQTCIITAAKGAPLTYDWYEENDEYLWAILGIALDRVSWHHVRCLLIYFDGKATFQGTYRFVPLSQSGRKRGLFLVGPLVAGQEVES
jgi:hypothetical protein